MTQQLADVVRSRFSLSARPFAAPGKCAVCGAVDRPVVDFGLDLDEYGVVYFCVSCLTQVAHDNLDMVPASDLRTTQSIVEELQNKLNLSAGTLDDYLEGISNLHDAYLRNINELIGVPDAEIDGKSTEVHESSSGGEQGEIRDSVTIEPTPDGSISIEGPVSIPTDSGNESRIFPFE